MKTRPKPILAKVIVAVALLFGLTVALPVAALTAAAAQLSQDVVVPWSLSEGAGFTKRTQQVSFGDYYDIENPVFETDETGQITQVVVFYERPGDGGPGLEYKVTITPGACDGCNTKSLIEQQLLAAEWGTTQYHWAGHPNFCSPMEDATYWPCVQEHILAGGLTAAEVYGYSTYDRNAGNAGSTYTAVAGDYTFVVDASVLKYGDYTAPLLEEFRSDARRLVDLYAAHLLGLPPVAGGGTAGSTTTTTGTGTSSFPGTAPADFVAPVAVIGAIAAVAAVMVTAAATAATGALTQPPQPPSPLPVLVDPDTGQALPVDGNEVWIGDWVSHEEAQKIIDQRIEEQALDAQAAAQHHDFVTTQKTIREDELADLGFTHNPATNSWVPGANTHAIINQKWEDKANQDPAWKAFQDDAQQTQQLINTQKDWLKKRYENNNKVLQNDYDNAMSTAANLGQLITVATHIKDSAGTVVNIVGNIPGPTQKLKWAYNAVVKGVETNYAINPETGQPNGLFEVVTNVGLQLAEDVSLDGIGNKIKLKNFKLPDTAWATDYVKWNPDFVKWTPTPVKEWMVKSVGKVDVSTLVKNTGAEDLVGLGVQHLKGKIVKKAYTGGTNITDQLGLTGEP